MSSERPVLVVTGLGGMGRAVCRRLGSGGRVLVADVDPAIVQAVVGELDDEGFAVDGMALDVTDADAVAELARRAAAHGPVTTVVHTAGVSPVSGSAERVLAVDLIGTANVLDEMETVVAPGGAGVVVASMAAHLGPPLDPADEEVLSTTPCRGLSSLPQLDPLHHPDPGVAYTFAKRANLARVRTAAMAWGRRGARVCSVSPGVVATPMGRAELAGASGAAMRAMVDASATGRLGTAHDVAEAVAFLTGPSATFITGIDLLVDGGVVAAATVARWSAAP
jgi:NAD(P)-dependent dehydrogenase (short-subunit alcohol dehydrogenase family)